MDNSEKAKSPGQDKIKGERLPDYHLPQNGVLFSDAVHAQKRAQPFWRGTLKRNWKHYKEFLEKYDIRSLYHFTDKDNLDSIQACAGLFSYLYCTQHHIVIPRPGGNENSRRIDIHKNLDNYVRLSFIKEHPMLHIARKEGRISQPVILEIDPFLIFLARTRFTTQNAAKDGVFAGSTMTTFQQIRFDLFNKKYFDLNVEDQSYYQAEVLVYERIPSEYIRDIKPLR